MPGLPSNALATALMEPDVDAFRIAPGIDAMAAVAGIVVDCCHAVIAL